MLPKRYSKQGHSKMNITQLIEKLEEIRNEKGDLRVLANDEVGSLADIQDRDLYVFVSTNSVLNRVGAIDTDGELVLAIDV